MKATLKTELQESLLCRFFFFGHKFGEWKYVDDGECEQVRVCRRDGYKEKREVHQFGEREYLRDNSGEQVRVCSRCKRREMLKMCDICAGEGSVKSECSRCEGTGGEPTISGTPSEPCYGCDGEGTITHSCSACDGSGTRWVEVKPTTSDSTPLESL